MINKAGAAWSECQKELIIWWSLLLRTKCQYFYMYSCDSLHSSYLQFGECVGLEVIYFTELCVIWYAVFGIVCKRYPNKLCSVGMPPLSVLSSTDDCRSFMKWGPCAKKLLKLKKNTNYISWIVKHDIYNKLDKEKSNKCINVQFYIHLMHKMIY